MRERVNLTESGKMSQDLRLELRSTHDGRTVPSPFVNQGPPRPIQLLEKVRSGALHHLELLEPRGVAVEKASVWLEMFRPADDPGKLRVLRFPVPVKRDER